LRKAKSAIGLTVVEALSRGINIPVERDRKTASDSWLREPRPK
jgi:hypothetical protein